jgi:hypothetical protein
MSAKRDRHLVAVMKRGGIVYPKTTLRIARKVNKRHGHMPLSLACAILEQETGGGHNVFGHDPVRSIVGGRVTRARYAYYKARRKAGMGMQGVGPTQLTWYEFQDEADRLGGCWRQNINQYVGLTHCAMQIRAHGARAGIAAYNGTGAAAESYARTVQERARKWHNRLS